MSCFTSWHREDDPELHDLYAEKLLEPGWAGELDRRELAYIKSQLQQSASMKRRWGFRPSARRLSTTRIRAVAMYGLSAKERGVSASPVREERRPAMKVSRVDKTPQPVDTKTPIPMRLQGKKVDPCAHGYHGAHEQ